MFLTPIILAHLPEDIRFEWAKVGEGKERDLQFLINFMQSEIERIERCETYQELSPSKTELKKPENKSVASAASLSSMSPLTPCQFCGKKHKSSKCFKVINLSAQEKVNKILELE